MRKRAFAFAAFALCLATQARAEDCAPLQLENTVKMTPIGDAGEVGLPVTLQGVEKIFLFDTGGGTLNYIAHDTALHLGMHWTDNYAATDVAGKPSYLVAYAQKLKFGDVSGEHVFFQIVPDLRFDGILSAGTMTGDDLDMDFGAMRLNFFSPDHCPGAGVYWPHAALAAVPVHLTAGHFEIAVNLDGHPLTAVIDTGAPWTILNLDWATKNGFAPDTARIAGAPPDDPEKKIFYRRYGALSFPGIAINQPLMVVRPLAGAPDIVIGMEVLAHLHLYYAANEKLLYITSASPTPARLPGPIVSGVKSRAWPLDAQHYEAIWDPIHRMH